MNLPVDDRRSAAGSAAACAASRARLCLKNFSAALRTPVSRIWPGLRWLIVECFDTTSKRFTSRDFRGKRLGVGSGVPHKQEDVPPVGSIVEVVAMDYSSDGLLREPRFKGVRFDKTQPD